MTFDRTMFIATAITAALTATAQAQQAQPYGKTPQATQPGMTQTQPSPSGQAAPGAGQPAAAAVTDRDIQAFASASNQIKQIKQKWHPQVSAAAKDGPQAQEKLERQAYAEMTSVVEKNGLTVDKYNQIAQLAQSNPDVQRKLERQQNPR
jgi:hypothetical protein